LLLLLLYVLALLLRLEKLRLGIVVAAFVVVVTTADVVMIVVNAVTTRGNWSTINVRTNNGTNADVVKIINADWNNMDRE